MIFKQSQLEGYIKNPDAKIKAFLIYGNNVGLINNTVKRLAQTVCKDLSDAFHISELAYEDVSEDISLLYSEYNSQSLLGGRRAIIVGGVGNQLGKDLRKMLNESTSDNLLILSSVEINKNSSLLKSIQNSEDVICCAFYEDKSEDIYNVLKKSGLMFESDALQLLLARLSSDRMVNLEEIEKLKTYMYGDQRKVTRAMVAEVISDQSESKADDICYAVMGGDIYTALVLYRKYIREGNETISLLRILGLHLMKLLGCIASIENGNSIDKAVSELKPALMYYRIDSFKQQLRNWNRNNILRALDILGEAEKDCKTTGMPSEDIVDYTLLRLARAVGRR